MRPRPPSGSAGDAGFTLVEVLMSAFLAALLAAVVLQGLVLQLSFSRVHPAAVDITERARAAADLVAADVAMAGAGIDEGPSAGTLACCLPAVSPRVVGLRNPDPPGTARADAVTVTFAVNGAVAARLQAPLVGATPSLSVAGGLPCPGMPLCGLRDEDTVVVFDRTEHHDFYRVAAPVGVQPELHLRQPGPGPAYAGGATLIRVETHTYYFDAAARQLRHSDGFQSDVPAIDGVVAARFEYWGEDQPPSAPMPPTGLANCLYDAAGTPLPWSGAAFAGRASLIPLPLSEFRDGPWCGSGENRFDADLMRVRRVRMSVTLQAPDDLRLRTPLFVMPGRSSSSIRAVRDLSFSIDVTPRNLNAGR